MCVPLPSVTLLLRKSVVVNIPDWKLEDVAKLSVRCLLPPAVHRHHLLLLCPRSGVGEAGECTGNTVSVWIPPLNSGQWGRHHPARASPSPPEPGSCWAREDVVEAPVSAGGCWVWFCPVRELLVLTAFPGGLEWNSPAVRETDLP